MSTPIGPNSGGYHYPYPSPFEDDKDHYDPTISEDGHQEIEEGEEIDGENTFRDH